MTHSQPPQSSANRPKMSEKIGGLIGLLASLVTVIGFVRDSNKAIWLILFACAVLALTSYFSWHKRWGLVAASLVVLALLGGAGLLTSINQQPSPTGQAGSSSNSPTATASPQPKASPASPKQLFNGQVTLTPNQSIDVDQANTTPASNQFALTGDADLFYWGQTNSNAAALKTVRGLFSYPVGRSDTNDTDSYNHCVTATSPDHPMYAYVENTGLYPGVQTGSYCFVTSSGHMAWLSIRGVSKDTEQAIFRVLVWDTIISN